MTTCYYSIDEVDLADIYRPRLDAKNKKDALIAAKEIAARYYDAENKESQKDVSLEQRKRIMMHMETSIGSTRLTTTAKTVQNGIFAF